MGVAILALSAAVCLYQEDESPSPPRARELFHEHCASCHGETGDGKGWTELDRPARSFRDGGFSYGNTSEAIYRTLTMGIPGTPMPSFDTALVEDDRRLLAEHVLTLGPPIREVDRSETILAVHERPRILRGMLPPIAEGAKAHPRGLLIGMPDGFTFEYRTDDVRLLGLRQGDFCELTDWTGRGGTPLKPLGQVVFLIEDGRPRAPFGLASTEEREALPVEARFRGTWSEGGNAGVQYELLDAEGARLARVVEGVKALATPIGPGFIQGLSVARSAGAQPLSYSAVWRGELHSSIQSTAQGVAWSVLRQTDGSFVCRGVRGDVETYRTTHTTTRFVDNQPVETITQQHVELALDPGVDRARFQVTTITTPEWTPEVRSTLVKVTLQ